MPRGAPEIDVVLDARGEGPKSRESKRKRRNRGVQIREDERPPPCRPLTPGSPEAAARNATNPGAHAASKRACGTQAACSTRRRTREGVCLHATRKTVS